MLQRFNDTRRMQLPCNLEVGVNGEEVFLLNQKPMLARCGLLVRLVKEACAVRNPKNEGPRSVLRVELENFPGGPEVFELAAKFCYNDLELTIAVSNVAALLCAAEFLEMSEDYGKANLKRRAESFLKHEVFWNWNDTLTVYRSCESFIPIAEKTNIILRCSNSLAFRASASPDNLSSPPSFSSDSHDRNASSGSNSSSCSSKSPVSGTWWFQDLSSLSVYLMERVIRAFTVNGIDHKTIAKFLLHYIRASLPTLGFGIGLLSPGKPSNNKVKEELRHVLKLQQEVLEVVVDLLSGLQRRSAACRSLFGLLRIAVAINGSKDCRMEIERMIGSQLEKATLDNILIPALPKRSSWLYDVDLVSRLVDFFLEEQAELLMDYTSSPSSDKQLVVERFAGPDLSVPVQAALTRVGELIDKYLAEVAADAHLKPLKFRSLAEALPDSARSTTDGLYRAVEIFLEAHPNLSATESLAVCKVINLQKLGLEACKRIAQNTRFPASFVLQVVLMHQSHLRSAADGCLPKDLKCKSARDLYSCSKEGRSGREAMVVHLECSNFEFVVRQNQEMKSNLKKMHSRVSELEQTYKRLRSEMTRLFKLKRRARTVSRQQ